MEGSTGNASLELAWSYGDEDNTTKYSQLLNNPIMSDFTFRVVSEDTVVPGHKLILSLCSWDFYNIFNLVKLDNYELIIEDVSLRSFLAFLKYCYTSKVDLTDCAMFTKTLDVLKLAQRFHMVPLVKICEEHIKSKVHYYNCMVFFKNKDLFSPESAARREIMRAVEQYFSILIRDQMSLDIIVNLPLKAVREIARDPLINCEEIEIFGVLMKWAKRNCEKKALPPDSAKNLRLVLRDVFYEIRFPSMQIYTFSKILAKYPGMFTQMEISNICSYICDGLHASSSSCMGFKCTPRNLIYANKYNSSILSFGQTLPSFSGAPQMDEKTFKIACEIETILPRKLIGIAFFAKVGETVNVKSFKFRTSKEFLWDSIEIISSGKFIFSETYNLVVFRFKCTEEGIWVQYYCELECMCDRMIPAISGSKVSYFGSGISLVGDKSATIPYLIFDFN